MERAASVIRLHLETPSTRADREGAKSRLAERAPPERFPAELRRAVLEERAGKASEQVVAADASVPGRHFGEPIPHPRGMPRSRPGRTTIKFIASLLARREETG